MSIISLKIQFRGISVLKGSQRKMIKLCGCNDTIFEEAYFVLKPEKNLASIKEKDILAEANRIIEENTSGLSRRKKRVCLNAAVFAAMLFLSAIGLCSLIALILGLW